MPRRPRVHLDGVPLHIVQRGHNSEPCLFGEEDYSSYLHWLGEALDAAQCALHAYVLMTNHVHLLLTPKKAEAVLKFILSLGRRYVQYINRSYRRSGTLWGGRFRSCLTATYLPNDRPVRMREHTPPFDPAFFSLQGASPCTSYFLPLRSSSR